MVYNKMWFEKIILFKPSYRCSIGEPIFFFNCGRFSALISLKIASSQTSLFSSSGTPVRYVFKPEFFFLTALFIFLFLHFSELCSE